MSDAVPKEFMQRVDDLESELHHNVARNVAELGQTISVGEVKPDNTSPLHKLGEMIGHKAEVLGTTLEEAKKDATYLATVSWADLTGGHAKVGEVAERGTNAIDLLRIQQERAMRVAETQGNSNGQITAEQGKILDLRPQPFLTEKVA